MSQNVLCNNKPVILVVISFLIAVLVYSSYTISDAFAERIRHANSANCWNLTDPPGVLCCYLETDTDNGHLHDVCRVCYEGPPVQCETRSDNDLSAKKLQSNEANITNDAGNLIDRDTTNSNNNTNVGNDAGVLKEPSKKGSPDTNLGNNAGVLDNNIISGGIAKPTCEGLKCTCKGDADCNAMFESGVCGDIASCSGSGDSAECSCLKG